MVNEFGCPNILEEVGKYNVLRIKKTFLDLPQEREHTTITLSIGTPHLLTILIYLQYFLMRPMDLICPKPMSPTTKLWVHSTVFQITASPETGKNEICESCREVMSIWSWAAYLWLYFLLVYKTKYPSLGIY